MMQLPTPTPSPPPTESDKTPSISASINAATRKQHTELNRLIIHRLPLALPPYAKTPALYSKGLVPFARLFVLFEVEWAILIRHVQCDASGNGDHDHDVRQWLSTLRPPGLERFDRLQEDLKHLRDVAGSQMFDTPELGEKWVERMRLLMRHKPHAFVAFAWVLYMAVFSGGRWIRQQLAHADVDFWNGQSRTSQKYGEKSERLSSVELPSFTFLSFDGINDGNDIKEAFKARLSEAEALLTAQERQEVIDVAKDIFERCIELVRELDGAVFWQQVVGWIPAALLFVLVLISLMLLYHYDPLKQVH